jgi:hypothetical protein
MPAMIACKSLPVTRRRVLQLTAGVALGAFIGCENADVGSMPKLRKSKAQFLEEQEAKSSKKKRAGGKGKGE